MGVSKEDSQASPKHSKAWVFGFRFREFDLELKGSYEGFRIACVCVWVVVNSHMHICIYTHACMHTYIHAYICIYAYVTMHVYIYMYIYRYVYSCRLLDRIQNQVRPVECTMKTVGLWG